MTKHILVQSRYYFTKEPSGITIVKILWFGIDDCYGKSILYKYTNTIILNPWAIELNRRDDKGTYIYPRGFIFSVYLKYFQSLLGTLFKYLRERQYYCYWIYNELKKWIRLGNKTFNCIKLIWIMHFCNLMHVINKLKKLYWIN